MTIQELDGTKETRMIVNTGSRMEKIINTVRQMSSPFNTGCENRTGARRTPLTEEINWLLAS